MLHVFGMRYCYDVFLLLAFIPDFSSIAALCLRAVSPFSSITRGRSQCSRAYRGLPPTQVHSFSWGFLCVGAVIEEFSRVNEECDPHDLDIHGQHSK